MKNLNDDYNLEQIEKDIDKRLNDFVNETNGDECINDDPMHPCISGKTETETDEGIIDSEEDLVNFFDLEESEEELLDFQKKMRLHPEDWKFCDPEHGFWREDLAYNYCKENNIPIIEYDGDNKEEYEYFRKFTISDPTFRYIIPGSDTIDYNLYYEECGEDFENIKENKNEFKNKLPLELEELIRVKGNLDDEEELPF